jgi:hypothetical protein
MQIKFLTEVYLPLEYMDYEASTFIVNKWIDLGKIYNLSFTKWQGWHRCSYYLIDIDNCEYNGYQLHVSSQVINELFDQNKILIIDL